MGGLPVGVVAHDVLDSPTLHVSFTFVSNTYNLFLLSEFASLSAARTSKPPSAFSRPRALRFPTIQS